MAEPPYVRSCGIFHLSKFFILRLLNVFQYHQSHELSIHMSVCLPLGLSLSFSLIVYVHNNDIFFKHFPKLPTVDVPFTKKNPHAGKIHGISRNRYFRLTSHHWSFLRPGADGLFFLGSGITPIVTLHRPADESWIVKKHTRGNWENIVELSVSSS